VADDILEECPYCEGTATVIRKKKTEHYQYQVNCDECGARARKAESMKNAVYFWNKIAKHVCNMRGSPMQVWNVGELNSKLSQGVFTWLKSNRSRQ